MIAELTPDDLRRIALKSGRHEQTIARYFRGGIVRPSSREQIGAALEELGFKRRNEAAIKSRGSMRWTAQRTFGSAEARTLYEAECLELLDEREGEFIVAPQRTVRMPDGTTLNPGDEVMAKAWQGVDDKPGWQHVARMVAHGNVLQRDAF